MSRTLCIRKNAIPQRVGKQWFSSLVKWPKYCTRKLILFLVLVPVWHPAPRLLSDFKAKPSNRKVSEPCWTDAFTCNVYILMLKARGTVVSQLRPHQIYGFSVSETSPWLTSHPWRAVGVILAPSTDQINAGIENWVLSCLLTRNSTPPTPGNGSVWGEKEITGICALLFMVIRGSWRNFPPDPNYHNGFSTFLFWENEMCHWLYFSALSVPNMKQI